jgi:hypothetical protein
LNVTFPGAALLFDSLKWNSVAVTLTDAAAVWAVALACTNAGKAMTDRDSAANKDSRAPYALRRDIESSSMPVATTTWLIQLATRLRPGSPSHVRSFEI